MSILGSIKAWARAVKRDAVALYFASRDPRVPWYAKAVAAAVAAYALSPIDLIPDFIPVLGYVDELVLLPLGIMLAVRLIPAGILEEHRAAAIALEGKPGRRAVVVAIVLVWVAAAAFLLWLFWPDPAR